MITFITYGVDPYTLGKISGEATAKFADLFETTEDNINFFATDGIFYHNGIEQNTWYVLVKVLLPRKLQIFQKDACKILRSAFDIVCIHMEVVFEYYSVDDREVLTNKDYPKYLTSSNLVDIAEDSLFDDEDEDDLFDGDAFEDYKEKLGE